MGSPERIIILDRDGLLNRKPLPGRYLRSPLEVEYIPGVKDALRRLAGAGFEFVITTNQMGIGLGIVSQEEVDSIHSWMQDDLRREGIPVRGWYVCPHRDIDGCDCRKPKSGLVTRAAAALGFSPATAWNLGDSPRDVLMGLAAGCSQNVLVRSGYEPRPEELVAIKGTPTVETLGEAVEHILQTMIPTSNVEKPVPVSSPYEVGGGVGGGSKLSSNKIKSLDELADISRSLKTQGKKIVLCHGVFDLLHPGHVRHLQSAKNHGDILCVTLTRDAYVNKGPGRPAFTETLRAETIAAIGCVDYVALNEPSPSALPAIEKIRPDFYVKGSEYAESSGGVTGNRVREREAVEAGGGRMAFTHEITFSSTKILNQHFNVYPEDAQIYLKDFRNRYRPEDVITNLERLRGMKVLVIGDAVIDEYHYTTPLGKAGKESLVVSKYQSAESFAGGIFALANHVAGFCDQVALTTVLGAQDSREDYIRTQLKPNVKPTFFHREDAVTTVKRRFVDAQFVNKLYEIYYFDDSPLPDRTEEAVWRHLAATLPEYDCVIVLDYMHGFLSGNLINLISGVSRFLAVNTQTNAGNTGFNLITKYPRADFICISEPELRLAARDRHAKLESLTAKTAEQLNAKHVVITRGPRGLVGYTPSEGFFPTPVLSTKVLDRVGAGDALLAVAAPVLAAGLPMDQATFLGAVAGAIAVTIVGNRTTLEYKDVARSVKAMLT